MCITIQKTKVNWNYMTSWIWVTLCEYKGLLLHFRHNKVYIVN